MNKTKYLVLVNLVNQADRAYWVDNSPIMIDAEFDAKLKEIQQLEALHPDWKAADSPSQRLGGGLLPGFATVAHVHPMLSLDNLFTPEDLERRLKVWAETLGKECVEVIVEPKVDGISCDLRYDKGMLVQALTRGTGTQGDDITVNVRTIRNVPLFVPELSKVETINIRGEIHMTFADFKLVNERQAKLGLPLFKNPRNATAGAVKSLDSSETAARRLSFVPYHTLSYDHTKLPVGLQTGLHEWFGKLGFKTLPRLGVGTTNDEVADLVVKFEAIKSRLPFPVDGAVIKLNNRLLWKQFPDGNKSVRWGYAYKYEQEEAETILKGITIQVGRTGTLAPVAELEPVELDGSLISRGTLCNERRIRVRDFRIGDTVVIQKDGAVIPGLKRVVLENRPEWAVPFVFPDRCPCCSKLVEKKTTEADGEDEGPLTNYTCRNPYCTEVLCGKLQHWADKSNMDIRGLGPVAAEKLVCRICVKSVADLYDLTVEQLHSGATEDVFGETEAENLYAAIQTSKERGMESVLAGLGIERIGNTLAKKLAKVYPDLSTFLSDVGSWAKHLGAADIVALSNELHTARILTAELATKGVHIMSKTYNSKAAAGKLAGTVICFTGALPTLHRDEAGRLAEAAGAKVTNSVSRKTNFLVCGAEAGSKLSKAKAAGVPVIDEEEFLALIAED